MRGRPLSKPKIVFEDEHLVIVDKPPGLLTSTVPRETRPTLLAMMRDWYADDNHVRIGLIHRLDRDARGLLVFSKSNRAYEALKSQLFFRKIARVYMAITVGVPKPPAGRIKSRLIERADGTVRLLKAGHAGEVGILEYKTVASNADRAMVRVELETGRKHQIRVQLQSIGCPILGDELYGEPPNNRPPLHLAAIELAMDHPITGKKLKYSATLPPEWTRLFRSAK